MIKALKYLLITLCLLSCADTISTMKPWKYTGPVNSCKNNADCDYATCNPKHHICTVTPPEQDSQLYVKVVTDPSTGTPSQIFEVNINADGNANEVIKINTPVTVIGNTFAQIGETKQPLSAHMIFADKGNRLPGHPMRSFLYEANKKETFESLKLLPSVYNITIIPEEEHARICPVHYMDNITLTTDGKLIDIDEKDIDILVPHGQISVMGTVYQGNQPMDGLEVRAIDPKTGRVVSTIAKTSCVPPYPAGLICGKYAISLTPGVTDFNLRITRYQEPHHPIIVKTGFTTSAKTSIKADLYLEPLGIPINYQARVIKPITSSSSNQNIYVPALNSLVFFRSKSSAIAGGRVERWVTTNESGYLEETRGVLGINLYEGCYDIIIVPPNVIGNDMYDYRTSIVPEPVCVSGSKNQTDEFILSQRPSIKGEVSAEGIPVPASIILAKSLSKTPGEARYNSTVTDNKGVFSLKLDISNYMVFAEAPFESNYAWGSALWNIDGDTKKSLKLKIPYVANINVAPSSDQTIPIDVSGATVEWYTVIDGKAYTVFRSVTDENGDSYALLGNK